MADVFDGLIFAVLILLLYSRVNVLSRCCDGKVSFSLDNSGVVTTCMKCKKDCKPYLIFK